MCGLSQLQCKSNNHTVIALKKMVGEFICESSMLHSLVIGKSQVDSSVLNVYLWLLYSMLHGMPLQKPCDGIHLLRSCYTFLGGHVVEISLLKSQVSFCLHIFPNTSWSLPPSGFQWTLIKMNLASCAFDLISFFLSWALQIKQCDMRKKKRGWGCGFLFSTYPVLEKNSSVKPEQPSEIWKKKKKKGCF